MITLYNFYLCDLDISQLERYTGDMVTRKPLAINYMGRNLVLLHEEYFDPTAEMEPDCSTQRSQIVLGRGIHFGAKHMSLLDSIKVSNVINIQQ